MPEVYHYPGEELALFEKAHRWKTYLAQHIRPHLRGSVLEVGAGIGATTRLLHEGSADRWVLLEPDGQLFAQLRRQSLPAGTELRQGTLKEIGNDTFDAILYIDVLEHIEEDAAEMTAAARLLKPGGRLVVLSPAHPFLFSPFDAAIGHYRRYTRRTLKAAIPKDLQQLQLRYLDTAGFFASAANRLLLRQQYPTAQQVQFWDRWLVRASNFLDPLTGHAFGKSILGVWQKPVGR